MTNPDSDGSPTNSRDDAPIERSIKIKVMGVCPKPDTLKQTKTCDVPYDVLWSRRGDWRTNTANTPPIGWANRTGGWHVKYLTISDTNYPCGQSDWSGLFVKEELIYKSGDQSLEKECKASVDGFVVGLNKGPAYTAISYTGGSDALYCKDVVGPNEFRDDLTKVNPQPLFPLSDPDKTAVFTHTYSCGNTLLYSIDRTFNFTKTNWTLPGLPLNLPNDTRIQFSD